MFLGIVLLVVDPQHHGEIFVLGRRRDDHLLGAALLDVHIRPRLALRRVALGIPEHARGFDHNLHPQVGPGQLTRILLRKHLDLLPVNN